MRAERNPREGHLPAVQVARDAYRRGGQLFLLDVVAALERDAHLGCEVDAAVEADVLRDILAVARRAVVDVIDRVGDRVVEAEIPRQRKVVIRLRHILPTQHGIEDAVGVVKGVGVLGRDAVDIVDRGRGVVLPRLEGVAERPAGRDDTAREEEFVDTPALRRHLVGVERGVELDAEVRAEDRRTELYGDGRELHRIGQKVVRRADREVVDQLDLLDA